MTVEKGVMFHEEQRFRQIWLWFIIILPSLVLLLEFINMLKESEKNIFMMSFFIFFGIGLPVFFYITKLTTQVRSDGIYFRFFPLHLSFHKIPFGQMKSYRAVTYDPINEYMGWGIRYGVKGKAYNVSGNRGVQVEFVNKRNILFGSQRPEEFLRAMDIALGKG